MSYSWLAYVPAYFLLHCNEGFSFSKWYFWSDTPSQYMLNSLPILYLVKRSRSVWQHLLSSSFFPPMLPAIHVALFPEPLWCAYLFHWQLCYCAYVAQHGIRNCVLFFRKTACFQKARGWAAQGELEEELRLMSCLWKVRPVSNRPDCPSSSTVSLLQCVGSSTPIFIYKFSHAEAECAWKGNGSICN